MSEKKEEMEQPTPEQITQAAERRAQIEKYWDDEIPFLEKQAVYEELVTRIEVAKMTRIEIMMAKAQMMQKPEDRKEEEDEAK